MAVEKRVVLLFNWTFTHEAKKLEMCLKCIFIVKVHWADTQLQFSLESSNSAATLGPPVTNESQELISHLALGVPHGLITTTWAGTPPLTPSPQLSGLLWSSISDCLGSGRKRGPAPLVLGRINLPETNDEKGKNSSLSETDLGWGNSDRDYEQTEERTEQGGSYVIVQINSESLQSL